MTFTSKLRNIGRLVFAGGKRAPDVDAREARALQEEGALILDVREVGEWRRAHIPGALHVPLTQVEDRLAEIPRDQPVVVHCALGSRSALAAKRLQALGFENVSNLSGGMRAWTQAELPIEREG